MTPRPNRALPLDGSIDETSPVGRALMALADARAAGRPLSRVEDLVVREVLLDPLLDGLRRAPVEAPCDRVGVPLDLPLCASGGGAGAARDVWLAVKGASPVAPPPPSEGPAS